MRGPLDLQARRRLRGVWDHTNAKVTRQPWRRARHRLDSVLAEVTAAPDAASSALAFRVIHENLTLWTRGFSSDYTVDFEVPVTNDETAEREPWMLVRGLFAR